MTYRLTPVVLFGLFVQHRMAAGADEVRRPEPKHSTIPKNENRIVHGRLSRYFGPWWRSENSRSVTTSAHTILRYSEAELA